MAEGGLVDLALVERFETSEAGVALVDVADGAPDGVVQRIVESDGGGALGGLGVAGPS